MLSSRTPEKNYVIVVVINDTKYTGKRQDELKLIPEFQSCLYAPYVIQAQN